MELFSECFFRVCHATFSPSGSVYSIPDVHFTRWREKRQTKPREKRFYTIHWGKEKKKKHNRFKSCRLR